MARSAVMQTDGYGRVLDACPKCGQVGPVPRFRVGVRPELLLPEVELGQLRCQGCARGVDGDGRYCASDLCRAARAAAAVTASRISAEAEAARVAPIAPERLPAVPAPASKPERVAAPRRYIDRACQGQGGTCQQPFTPTGPRSQFGPCCKER